MQDDDEGVPPHPSRCGLTPFPAWEKAFMVVRFTSGEGILLHFAANESLRLEEKVGGFSRSDEV